MMRQIILAVVMGMIMLGGSGVAALGEQIEITPPPPMETSFRLYEISNTERVCQNVMFGPLVFPLYFCYLDPIDEEKPDLELSVMHDGFNLFLIIEGRRFLLKEHID